MKRFTDKNLTLKYFEKEIFVHCPQCNLRAIVTKDDHSYYSKRTLKCPNCMYFQKGRDEIYTISLNCHCPTCSNGIKVLIPNVKEKKEEIAIRCSKCNTTNNYKPRNINQELVYSYNNSPADPYFQLPLWLNESVKDNVFWAYSYEHLSYLKDYLSADLREKNGREYWTMVEKLPTWMTSKKNRELVLKAILKLERK